MSLGCPWDISGNHLLALETKPLELQVSPLLKPLPDLVLSFQQRDLEFPTQMLLLIDCMYNLATLMVATMEVIFVILAH